MYLFRFFCVCASHLRCVTAERLELRANKNKKANNLLLLALREDETSIFGDANSGS